MPINENAEAKLIDTVDFPTPPLPLAIAIIFFTPSILLTDLSFDNFFDFSSFVGSFVRTAVILITPFMVVNFFSMIFSIFSISSMLLLLAYREICI